MRSIRSQLPPPNSLVAFEAAARHLSFTKAAGELSVTRVAVSHQIKSLETFLDASLFHRLHRALALTPEGERLQDAVSAGLQRIIDATAAIRDRDRNQRVTVTASTGFTTFWLLPRIGEFRSRYPDLDLRFLVSDEYLNLAQEGANVAIRYGGGDWPGVRATPLVQEVIFPVCSPAYLKGRTISSIHDLRDETLLFLEGSYDAQTKWAVWFDEHGVEMDGALNGIRLNAYTNLVQATLDGQGVALIGPPLMERYIGDGSLVALLDVPPVERKKFYLVLPEHEKPNDATREFCDWIANQITGGEFTGFGTVSGHR